MGKAKKEKTIYYFGGYAGEEVASRKPASGYNAGTNKMNYITSLLKRLGHHVTILAYYHSQLKGRSKKVVREVDAKETRVHFSNLCIKHGVFRRLSGLFTYLIVFFELLRLPRKSTLLLYNMPQFAGIVSFVQKCKKFDILLDIEEVIYFLHEGKKQKKVQKSEEKLYRLASRYIVVNDLIPPKFLDKNKPYVVLYGNYHTEEKLSEKRDDGKIHVLFSGSIDRIRGAFKAVACAKFLPSNYVVHLTGGGREDILESLREEIGAINTETSSEKVIYHGQLPMIELPSFVQQMHIGLNMQDPNHPFADVSFPSKIIFYLANGLNVVSTAMPSVMQSKIAEHVTFFAEDNLEVIAKAIEKTVVLSCEDNQKCLSYLDNKALKEMEYMLNE